MFLVLSKVLDLAVEPLTWALGLSLLSLALRHRGRRAVLPGLLAVALLYGFSMPATGRALARLAEGSAATTYDPGRTYDAAVVLGGLLDVGASRASGEVQLNEAVDRLTRTFELFREGRVRTIVISGGDVWPADGQPPEAERLAAVLERWGVPRDRIVLETRSRNTRENALETARLVSERQLLSFVLVTSARHVPRALGCFRAVGLHPDVLPVDRHASAGTGAGSWAPRAEALAESTGVLRELTGRAVYRVMGYTR